MSVLLYVMAYVSSIAKGLAMLMAHFEAELTNTKERVVSKIKTKMNQLSEESTNSLGHDIEELKFKCETLLQDTFRHSFKPS